MVTFLHLRDAHPDLWLAAGCEWHSRAAEALVYAHQLRHECDAIRHIRTSPPGRHAAGRLVAVASHMWGVSAECESIGCLTRGLGHALAITRDTLRYGINLAARHGISIDDNGTVLPPSLPSPPLPPHQIQILDEVRHKVIFLVRQSVDGATRADMVARDGLLEVGDVSRRKDFTRVLSGDFAPDSRREINIIAGVLPQGDAAQIAYWWACLSSSHQSFLIHTIASELSMLAGIPASALREFSGEYLNE